MAGGAKRDKLLARNELATSIKLELTGMKRLLRHDLKRLVKKERNVVAS